MRRCEYPALTACAVLALLVTGIAVPAAAQVPPQALKRCEALQSLKLPDTQITLARAVIPPEGGMAAPGTGADGPRVSRPFCRVAATVAPAIRFEVWMPLADWNGRFQGTGLGAFLGAIRYGSLAQGVEAGYAVASTDAGHESAGGDASWALQHNGDQLVADWAHRGIHEMSVQGQAITAAFYGRPADYTYFTGCSSGGHQALTEAQRYPQDYDGIVAGSPANYWTHLMAGQIWYGQSTMVEPGTSLEQPRDELHFIHQSVLEACDSADGVADGVIENPLTCHFDPGRLNCAVNDDARCLSDQQTEALSKVYGDARTAAGEKIFPGLAPGSELGWRRMTAGQVTFAETFYRDLVFGDPDWHFADMDLAQDVAYADDKIGAVVNSVDPDLSRFRAHGGKLIQYHGWSDPLISPYNSVDYYRSVVARSGKQGAGRKLADTQSFYRLFMVPGMSHCRGGDGTDEFDALAAVQKWVETGAAPERIRAAKRDQGRTLRTRPLCPFPKVAHWSGEGSSDEAKNFACIEPAR